MEERIILIEQIGNLLELKMNALLEKKGITLRKNPDSVTSQQYFFLKNSNFTHLEETLLSEIHEVFNRNFSIYDLGCALNTDCIYFGIAHLFTNQLEYVLNNFKKTK